MRVSENAPNLPSGFPQVVSFDAMSMAQVYRRERCAQKVRGTCSLACPEAVVLQNGNNQIKGPLLPADLPIDDCRA